jgi:hypothetical protein
MGTFNNRGHTVAMGWGPSPGAAAAPLTVLSASETDAACTVPADAPRYVADIACAKLSPAQMVSSCAAGFDRLLAELAPAQLEIIWRF